MENTKSLSTTRIGFALCGSFCTFGLMLSALEELAKTGYDITPIMSETAYSTSTRFGNAEDFVKRAEDICGKKVLHSVTDVEPIGPKKLLDLLVIAPCTGNTLSKLANGISDSAVTLCAKAHLRNNRPVLIGISSNDALSANAKNIGILLNTKNYFFIPFGQDDAFKKPTSLIAKTQYLNKAVESALEGKQLQPIIV